MLKKQNGITLIALIITIIVMLILVGVTINVALNGGLFEKGEKAAYQTQASTVKEQIEMAKALKVMNAKGKPVDDYSDIIVGTLPGLDQETRNKYANKIVVNKNGNICYNPESVTQQEKVWLEEIGIYQSGSNPSGPNNPNNPNNSTEPEDPYKNLYNVAYEKTIGGMQMELALYKNRMYTVKIPGMYGGAIYIGDYSINEQGEIFIPIMFGNDDMTITISEDMNTLALTGNNEYFDGNWIRNDSKIDNYNPTYLGDEKDIYANAIYYSEGKVITISSERIIYDQDQILGSGAGIKLEDYDKTNTTITTQNNGTEIVYNGRTYNLITKEQLNAK